MPDDGPILIAALLCERILEEKDGTLTVVRITDKVTLRPPRELPEGTKAGINLAGLIALKSGSFVGDATVQMVMTNPAGQQKPLEVIPVSLPGGEKGINLTLNLMLALDQIGFYWFDVLVNGQLRSRIPLEVAIRIEQ